MASNKLIYKQKDADIRLKYQKWFEASLIVALCFVIGIFYAFKRFEIKPKVVKKLDILIEIEQIPQTRQIKVPPPPPRPRIPIESVDEDIPEDLTIEETEIDLDEIIEELPPPPAEEEDPVVPFYALSEKPEVIKRVSPIYPELAKKANIEGMVVLKVLVNTDGKVEKVEILKSHPMLEQAAIHAVKQFEFKPGKQRDKRVKVWMSIPFNFRLR